MLPEGIYTTLADDLGRVLTVGPRATALLAALPDPWEPLATIGDDTPAKASKPIFSAERPIPTLESDSLLASARGRWRMPRALQRQDFEFWTRSLMWHAIKSKEVVDYKAWCAFFPKRPKTRTKTKQPRNTTYSEPRVLPRSIFEDEAYHSQEQ